MESVNVMAPHFGSFSPNRGNQLSAEFPAFIETERFILRKLTLADVSETYLGWLSDPESQKWIVTATKSKRIADLKDYVAKRLDRADVLFLGIFERNSGLHIGNIKYEPMLPDQGLAVMGILIGDTTYRGKGVFGEVFGTSAAWLKKERQITRIHLGVEKANISALKAYQKAGFVPNLALNTSVGQHVLMMEFFV